MRHASALMASVALPVHASSATTIHVMNCNDSGVGSLRGSVATAYSGETIDLARLPCSRIVLTSGQIVIPQKDLTLVGPGRSKLTLDGNHASRVLLHTGGGNLVVKAMSIANGYFHLFTVGERFRGGCIASDSNVELNTINLHDCLVEQIPTGDEWGKGGGGVFAHSTLRVINSNIFSNTAKDGFGGGAYAEGHVVVYRSRIYNNNGFRGGGLMAGQCVSIVYSTVDGNTASIIDKNAFNSIALGGGIYTEGELVVDNSTVSNNRVVDGPGGGSEAGATYVNDSTFSGNEGNFISAVSSGTRLLISNSTIAFNRSMLDASASAVVGHYTTINSSIIAHNLNGNAAGYDVSKDSYFGDGFVRGANNIIGRATPWTSLPPDTLSVDPLLAPLANNGGPTKTHALLNGSPAIDRGSNLRHRLYDQRGPGFPRVKGTATDIGAFKH